MARVKYYDQASQEWKYADAALNMKGKDGYTPQKGIDYFTEEDVRELTENVLDQGVLTYNEQELTEEQKAQARENIGIDQISFDKLTEDLDADGFRITNLPLPQSGSEPATKEFVENFTIEGSTYVATDDGEGNVTIRPYLADEDELVFKSHIQNQNNPHNVTAAQVGARPNNWMPTAEEVKARPDTWIPTAAEVGAATPQDVNTAKTTAISEAKTYTNEQVKKAAPRNLLINSDFRNPVNQRGFVSGTEGAANYTIDRWKLQYSTYIGLEEDSISLWGHWGLWQPINQKLEVGKKYTLAVECKGENGNERLELQVQSAISGVQFKHIENNIGTEWKTIAAVFTPYQDLPIGDYSFDITLFSPDGQPTKTFIRWAALYEGEYTLDTLPEYQPKGYENELMICRQYDPSTGEYIGLRKFGQPRNLLDNSDWRVKERIVNQKGKDSYTATNYEYAIDRWKMDKSGGVLNVANGGIQLVATSGSNFALSHRSKNLPDGVYTFAAKTAEEVILYCFSVNGTTVAKRFDVKGSSIALGAAYYTGGAVYYVQLIVYSGATKTVEWAALYPGEYTLDTLPEYHPKEYAVELAECRRYYRKKNNALVPGFVSANLDGIVISIENDEPFYKTPELNVTAIHWIRGSGKNTTTIPGYTESVYSNNNISPVYSIDFDTAIDQTSYASVYVYMSYELVAEL